MISNEMRKRAVEVAASNDPFVKLGFILFAYSRVSIRDLLPNAATYEPASVRTVLRDLNNIGKQ